MEETQVTVRMTRAQRDMAIAIAHDVIAQLRRTDGQAMEIESHYVYIEGGLPRGAVPVTDSDDLSLHVDAIQANCTVCMLGACLLSKARLFDSVPIAAFLNLGEDDDDEGHFVSAGRGDVTRHLHAVFDEDTMDALEAVFESGYNGSDAERAVAIMENLIKNDGLFDAAEFEYGDVDDEDDDWDEDEEEDEDDEDEDWDEEE